jgi:hypothetical protein
MIVTETTLNDRDKRRLRRDKKKAEKQKQTDKEKDKGLDESDTVTRDSIGAIYVAYVHMVSTQWYRLLMRVIDIMTGNISLPSGNSKGPTRVYHS